MTLRYRLYLDESGDNVVRDSDDPAVRYLGLTGCIVEAENYRGSFQPALETLKQRHFPHSPDDPVVLHRKEIVGRVGPFWRLKEPRVEAEFNHDLLEFLAQQGYWLVSVAVDKQPFASQLSVESPDPYVLCYYELAQAYVLFLGEVNGEGDILAESRGGREDRLLKVAHRALFDTGGEGIQGRLTSRQVKLKRKEENIAGLQIADVLAYPMRQDILIEHGRLAEPGSTFGRQIAAAVRQKFFRPTEQSRRFSAGK